MLPWRSAPFAAQLLFTFLATLGLAFAAQPTAALAASPTVVISQVYGGGGNAGTTYTNDFVELHNRSGATVSLVGWSVQYASASGSAWSTTALSGSIPAGGYFLVQQAAGTGGTTALPTPDATGTIAMSASAGKVALLSSTTALSGTCPANASIVDLMGYGAASCSEGSPTAALSNPIAALRESDGCVDTDDNLADFSAGLAAPRNSATAARSCQYSLSVVASPLAGGTVDRSPDQASYLDGSVVQLTATPAVGWHFVGWSGAASGSTNPLDVTMDADKSITATFAIDQHTLTLASVGSGSVARLPDQPSYDFGSVVQLTASPAVGWHFVGWSGAASGSTNPLDVTMDADKSITATFAIDQHTLTLASVGSGSVARLPDQPSYDFGSVVQLTASPAVGWHFVGWSGAASGTTNPLDVTMDADKSITATFAIDQHTLTLASVGSGSVARLPDQPSYDFGSVVQLTATPAVGWHFVGWSGAASGSTNPLDVTMDADKSITATFAIDQHTLTLASVGSGSVARLPDQPSYDFGSVVQLTATPAVGWHFVGWSGAASGSTNPLDVTMDADKSITATFAIDQHTLTLASVGSGSVARLPDQPSYDFGSVVQLTATPAVGWHFVGWSGAASGTTNPLDVTMDADKSITATFAIDQHTLTLASVGSGSVARLPDQPSYDFGSVVQLTATPAVGWHFVGWSGAASGSTNPLDVTMDADKSITATFAIDQHTLTLASVGSGSVARLPDQPSYDFGSVVQLTATPAVGWHFVGWSGAASGTTNPLDVTMDADKSITATFAVNLVVVSQVYGGGGNSGATYTHDFIELFNRGTSGVDLTGWTVQYASSGGSTWQTTTLSGTILPGRYYLVQQAQGVGGSTSLPTPEATGTISMNATTGKVALVNAGTALSGTCPSEASIEDLVGYGAASCSETAPIGSLSNVVAAHRKSAGCIDTDDNSADFLVSAPTPRNGTSPFNNCEHTLTVTVDTAPNGSVAISPDLPSYADGAVVQLTAAPSFGFHFVKWTGHASGNANPLSVTMDANKVIVAHFASNSLIDGIVISQVYGGGGNAGSTYKQDFVELYNRGNFAVNITGWSLQYASANGSTWFSTNLIGTLQPGQNYLIRQAQGVGGLLDIPAADAIGTVSLSAVGGKLALVSDGVVLTGNCPTGATILDFVGYGSSDCFEVAAAPALDNITAGLRNSDGCDDSDHNAADFLNIVPAPRNLATPAHFCPEWVDVGPVAVTEFALSPVAPNPSRGSARISFALPTEANVRLRVMDVQGRVVSSLAEGRRPAGRHSLLWDGTTPAGPARSGMYFIRLDADGKRFVRSVMLTQ